jgi:thiamine-phosphate diphosphorylase
MRRFAFPSPLYAIVDVTGRESDPLRFGRALLAGGAHLLQLRWKDAPSAAFVDAARASARACREHGALLVVNDRVDVALAAGADGVHLGQDDLPVAAARAIAGERLRIGLSTHTVAQAIAPGAADADYLAFGPVFATTSKETGYEPRGLELLAEIRRRVADRPLVAIGGIGPENAPAVLAAGADAVAMISALRVGPDPAARAAGVLAGLGAQASPAISPKPSL